MKTPLIVDIETDGRVPQKGRLLCVGWCVVGEESHVDGSVGPRLQAMLADPERPVVSMTKYDPRWLRLQGWEVTGPYYDLQVMAWVLNENQTLSLDKLAQRYLGLKMDKRLNRSNGVLYFKCDDGRKVAMTDIHEDAEAFAQMVEYCRRDVEAEAQLFNTLWASLESTAWLDYFLAEEVPFTETLLGMECSGLPVNLEDSEALRARLEVEADASRAALLRDASLPPGFNVNSGDQLAKYLYQQVFALQDKLPIDAALDGALKSIPRAERVDYVNGPEGMLPPRFTAEKVGRLYVEGVWTLPGRGLTPTEKTESGSRWSTSSPVLKSNLRAMQDEWVVQLLGYRKVEKVLTTYLRRFPELASDGRLYGRFNQTGTKTGRLSSSEPNLQNIPSHGPLGEAVRGLFQGDLVVGDYSQLEPRLMAHFSCDPLLVDVYTTGKDIYLETARGIFGRDDLTHESTERGIAKTLVLAMGYGAGPFKVAQILTVNGFPTTEDQAKGYLRELQSLYATFFSWREAVISRVKQRGYVTTLGGRHRRLKAAFADRRNFKNIGYGSRQAVNAVVQGSAGDIVRAAMIATVREFPHLTLMAQVHDELVWEAPSWGDSIDWDVTLAEVRHTAETAHAFDLRVPLVFEPHRGTSWFAAKEGIELPEDMNEESDGYEEE